MGFSDSISNAPIRLKDVDVEAILGYHGFRTFAPWYLSDQSPVGIEMCLGRPRKAGRRT